nr:virulence factor SrfC family protein [uncultured Hyphomonas sp.]
MSDMTPEALEQSWNRLHECAGKGIEWVEKVRETAPSVASEAEGLVEKLRRVRNLSRKLGQVSGRPMSVGFFGLSQAGKSYLISALSAGENGRLETVYDGQRLDFIDHVNPPGKGKEATGLVTRFTRRSKPGPDGYPIEMKLFSEVDLVKILGNSFLNDFDKEKVEHNLDPGRLHDLLNTLESRAQHGPTDSLTEDDIIDLWDYFQLRYTKTSDALKGEYWPRAVRLAPRLSLADRAELYAVLWGEVEAMTDAFNKCRSALESLAYAPTIYAPLSAIVTKTPDGKFSQADSIMNVDILGRLGGAEDDLIEVLPFVDDRTLAPARVSRALLAALTVELVFPLVEEPVTRGIEEVDLLDFPGYRGRLSVEKKEDASGLNSTGDGPLIADLLLRGKVAYLFERYTEHQEMNVLIVCTPSNKQSDVTEVGPVLSDWIDRTQGATPEIRAQRSPGLVWAITMFDIRVQSSLGDSEDLLRIAWGDGGLMKMTLLERFGRYSWLNNWSKGQPFNNIFLVRKPRLPGTFMRIEGGDEKGVQGEYSAQFDLMKKTFVADPTVSKHFSNAAEAWDAMAKLNDGGMSRLAHYLCDVTPLKFKVQRLEEQLNATIADTLEHSLGRYFFSEGAGETGKKEKIAAQVNENLRERAPIVGELISRLHPRPDQLRTVYLRAEDGDDDKGPAKGEEEEVSSGALKADGLISFDFEEAPIVDIEDDSADHVQFIPAERRFARAATRYWIKQLRSLPDEESLLDFMALSKDVVSSLVDEVITGALRLKIEDKVFEATRHSELEAGLRSDQLVQRQVLAAQRVFADMLAQLGQNDVALADRAESVAAGPGRVGKRRLFEPPPEITNGTLPKLGQKPVNFSAMYLVDWMAAFKALCVGNAGHSAGRDITPEQNAELGEILAPLRG